MRNQRLAEVERTPGSHLLQAIAQAGPPRVVAYVVFEDLKKEKPHGFSGQPVPVLCHLQSMQVLPDIQRKPSVLLPWHK